MKFTIMQFNDRFPTSDACLEEIKLLRFSDYVCPKCGREDKLSKVSGRPVYACNCGNQVHPLAGTIFHKSSTDLRTWFYAMYLMTQTRAGISAMQLMRETGVTYKTAWRIFKQIRSLMEDNDGDLLTGTVEVDETYVGGIVKGELGKAANVVSDQHPSYTSLTRMGYKHSSVNHSVTYVTAGAYTRIRSRAFGVRLRVALRACIATPEAVIFKVTRTNMLGGILTVRVRYRCLSYCCGVSEFGSREL